MRKYMLLLISVLLTFVTSVAYSALSTSLAISSEVKFRPLADIRINEIALAGATGGGTTGGAGGGGSGYIGGVTSASTTNGQRSGHGYATISWVG